MPLIKSRFVQFEGLVRFLGGNISINSGSSTSHSESVKLLEYGIVTALEDDNDFTSFHQKMSNGFYKKKLMDIENGIPSSGKGLENVWRRRPSGNWYMLTKLGSTTERSILMATVRLGNVSMPWSWASAPKESVGLQHSSKGYFLLPWHFLAPVTESYSRGG